MKEETADEMQLSVLEMAMHIVDHVNSIEAARSMLKCLVDKYRK